MPRTAIVFEARYEGYLLSTDRARLDPAVVFEFLTNESYWARGMTIDQLRRVLGNGCHVLIQGKRWYRRLHGQRNHFGQLILE